MLGTVVGIIIGVGAVACVIGVAIRSYIKRKNGETCCGFCESCTHCSRKEK